MEQPGTKEQAGQPSPTVSGGRSVFVSALLVLGALAPVALLSFFSYHMASARLRGLVRSSNENAAAMIGELVRADLARNIDMARALSAQPDMIAAVQRRDVDAVRLRLKATIDAVNHDRVGGVATRRLDRAYVTDPTGLEWSDYPHAPESIGKNFSDRDWYKGVTRTGQPYLSEVYVRNSKPQILVCAMAAPIRDGAGTVIGFLVFQMPLEYLSSTLRQIQVGGGAGHVYVVDKGGTTAAHPYLTDMQNRRYREPADSTAVVNALAGQSGTGEYDDPFGNGRMVAAFHSVSVPDGTWAVVAQQPASDVYGPIRRLGLSIAIAGAIVAGTAFLLVGTLRRASVRDRKLSRALDAERRHLAELAAELEQSAAAERAARLAAQQAHDTLRETQGRLVQTEKLAALGQLVAGVAHEINNPLAFVLNNVAVLQRDVKSIMEMLRLYQTGDAALDQHAPDVMQRVRDLADRIDLAYTMTEMDELPVRTREGLSRIQQIVKDLRDFARQNAIGDVQPGADLNAGIESTLNIARGLAKKHRVELVADLEPLPGVTCSPGKINQVVLNLVTNAVHASPEGGRVTVRTRTLEGGGSTGLTAGGSPGLATGVCVQVADNGCGIDPAIRGRIFDPFFTTKPQGVGTGLGLSISHGIVADHGGHIEVESEPGRGTTFTVSLPLSPPTSAKTPGTDGGGARRSNADAAPVAPGVG